MIKPDFAKEGGLLPAIAQDFATGKVLMMAFMNEEAWDETCRTKHAVYYSRSRKKLWRKGEESGNVQVIKDIRVDCDCDTVIFMVEQIGGAACHTGHRSCFYTSVSADGTTKELSEPIFDPAKVYGK